MDQTNDEDRERARQRSIEALNVLGTPREERFDRITRLASTVFGVPIAAITFMDRNDQWFKSCVGSNHSRGPRAISFCEHVVASGSVVQVHDAAIDLRFFELPWVTGEPHIRFYAGFPIRDAHGTTIGTLCLYGPTPRTLDERELAIGDELASWVEAELQTGRDARRARAVQRALLPAAPPDLPGYSSAALCRPATTVAGDFFDHLAFDDRHAFVVGDVMGKGVGAAILMSTVRAVLRAELRSLAAGRFDLRDRRGDVGDVVTAVNDAVLEDLGSSQAFVTTFVGWAEPATGRIDYVDAGHGLTVVLRADGSVERLTSEDLPLGITGDHRWQTGTITLGAGDHLVCFSDGLLDLLDRTSPGRDDLEALHELAARGVTPQELVDQVDALVGAGALVDDVTVLAIRREGVD